MKLLRSSRKIDFTEYLARIKPLAPRTRAAHAELSQHYWTFGCLPREDHDLAAICNIHVTSLRRMKVQLGWVFDLDGTGLWRDYELEAERAVALDISAKRAASGLLGAVAKQARARGLALSAEALQGMANTLANASPDATESGVDSALDALANANPFASALPGSGARVDDDDDEDSEKESLGSSSSSSSSPAPREAEPVAGATRFATPEPVANASPAEAPPAPAPAFDVAALERQHGLTSAELLRLITERAGRVRQGRHKGQSKLAPDLRSPEAMEPLWRLVADGCDPRNDVVPAFGKCQTLTDDFLGKIDAGFIVKAALARRDHRLTTLGGVTTASAAMARGDFQRFWIPDGSRERQAWADYEKANPGKAEPWVPSEYKGEDPRFRGTKGWWRKTEWPPGYEPARAAAE